MKLKPLVGAELNTLTSVPELSYKDKLLRTMIIRSSTLAEIQKRNEG